MSIKQLIYVSEEAIALSPYALTSLVEKARKSNQTCDVTGVLLYSSGRFAQCLEGQPPVIDALFRRIRSDSRHSNVVVLQDMHIPGRCFGEWSMGCVSVGESELLDLRSADWQSVISAHADRSWVSPGFMLMESLWQMYRGVAE